MPFIVDEASVEAFIRRVESGASSLFSDIANAPIAVADGVMRSRYTEWYVGWRSFVAASAPGVLDELPKIPPFDMPLIPGTPPRNLAGIYESTEQYRRELSDWRDRFVARGGVPSSPDVAAPPMQGDLLGTVRTVAIGGAIVAGALALVYVATKVPSARRRR